MRLELSVHLRGTRTPCSRVDCPARLSITTRAYPLSEEATHLALVNDGKRPVQVESATVWGMRSIYHDDE